MQILTNQTKIESIPDQFFNKDAAIKNAFDDSKMGALLSSICYVDPQKQGSVYFPANYKVEMALCKEQGKVSIVIHNKTDDEEGDPMVKISYSSFDPMFRVEMCQYNKGRITADVEATMAFNFDYVEARNEVGINKVSKAINTYLEYQLIETDFELFKN